ncbi:MAG: glycine--tRNA ligase subunit beta, partial [Chloroflexota bacterium]
VQDLRLSYESLHVYGTPRRLVVYVKDLTPKQSDIEIEHRGPPANRAFEEDGKPTKAAEGFARSKGIPVEALKIEEIDGGQYAVARVKEEGQPAVIVLGNALVDLIAGIRFDKSMRWNSSDVAFSRPIRWIVALFGNTIIPFSYAGVVSGNVTYGLRSYGALPDVVENAQEYFDALGKQGIAVSRDERRQMILEQIHRLAAEVDGTIPDDPALLDEVTNLVEAPTALRGTFEEKYLELPRDVLVTVMRKHQRYFPVIDGGGNLLPYFITVRNGDDRHLDKVIHGNEHVIRARFSDADFFYKEDVKKPLEGHLPSLSTLTFQEKLGSMLDKNNRVASLTPGLGDLFGFSGTQIGIATRAGNILKADLATSMVVEMTSLQGVMGREYAMRKGYPEDVARAIFEHWLPRSADDQLPETGAGTLLALVDRLDSLVGLFAVGLAPRSTADPYGLRRAALGIIQILVAHEIDVDLRQAISLVAVEQPVEVTPEHRNQVLEFIVGRLRVWLGEQGFAPDVIAAVLAEQQANPYRALTGVRQLSEWVAREDWSQILDNFARCVRITSKESERYAVDPALFQQDEEYALYGAYEAAVGKLENDDGNVDGFLQAFEPMVPVVANYFGTGKGEGVLVNADDPAVRKNRLGLLQAISGMQRERADLSELSGF